MRRLRPFANMRPKSDCAVVIGAIQRGGGTIEAPHSSLLRHTGAVQTSEIRRLQESLGRRCKILGADGPR
jgi:hypothetical protein